LILRHFVGLGALAVTLLLAAPAAAKIERFAVLIGDNLGAKDDVELRYAESDAGRMYDVLKDLGGFPPTNVIVLRGEPADVIRQTLITMNDRVRQAMTSPDTQALFVVYYSGHADAAALHAAGTQLEVRQVEQLVRGSAASFRVLILDSCRSGALTRVKGGLPAPAVNVRLDARLAGEGVVFLTSTAANEDAQEADALQGSFFTHYFASGLMGAADEDGDGVVDLEEAYRHAYDATIRATSKTFSGTQHPTFQYELRGHGKIVLTSPAASNASRATVVLPPGRSYLLFSGAGSGPVVAEVTERDTSRRLSLKPGPYFIRGRAPDALLEAEVVLPPGSTLEATDDHFTRIAYARLVRKGSPDHAVSHGPQAGYRFRTGLAPGAALCHGFFAGWAVESEHLSFAPRIGACRATFTNDVLTTTQDQLDVELRLSHAWDLPRITLDLGAAVGVGVLHQSFTTRGIAPDRTSFLGELSVGLGVTLDLPAGLYALTEVAAQTYFFQEQEGQSATATSLAAAFAVRPAFGVGKRF
jgi:hypothetical protein